jgi:hypothetical protein
MQSNKYPNRHELLLTHGGVKTIPGTVDVAGQKLAVPEGEIAIANIFDFPYKLEGNGVIW